MERWLAMLLTIACCAGAQHASAADRESIERRVGQAVAQLESEGLRALCAAVIDPDGPYQTDEAYVFAFRRDGALMCHPRPDLIKQQAGQPSGAVEMLERAERRPNGAWTRYDWPNPDTRQIGVKSTFCRISGLYLICAGGFFDVGLV